MKKYLTATFLTINILSSCMSMVKSSSTGFTTQSEKSDSTVSFVTIFDIKAATKDGYYLNGYVVTVDYKQAQKINGNKIKVTGEVIVVKGIGNQADEYNKDGNKIIKQGREEDTKHIVKPSIEVLE
jgi:hypothetical protein